VNARRPKEAHDNRCWRGRYRAVIVNALVEQGEMSGRGLDALFAMRQAETIVKALGHAGYEIRRRS
jgi:hypothetical protein